VTTNLDRSKKAIMIRPSILYLKQNEATSAEKLCKKEKSVYNRLPYVQSAELEKSAWSPTGQLRSFDEDLLRVKESARFWKIYSACSTFRVRVDRIADQIMVERRAKSRLTVVLAGQE
jgi:hypothetical protein